MYKSIIINLLSNKIEESLNIFNKVEKDFFDYLDDDGTFWIITQNYLSNNNFIVSSLSLADRIQSYHLRNIILVPDFQLDYKRDNSIFENDTFEILFYSKNESYSFEKDLIREKHIWKDVEWGKREKNYNPLGKFPGNVWLQTEDDGCGKITKHLPFNLEKSINRIIKCSTTQNDSCLIINLDIKFKSKTNIITKNVKA